MRSARESERSRKEYPETGFSWSSQHSRGAAAAVSIILVRVQLSGGVRRAAGASNAFICKVYTAKLLTYVVEA